MALRLSNLIFLETKTTEALMAVYKKRADQYDVDLLTEMGYKAPAITTAIFIKALTGLDAKILYVGCGTGIVGTLLTESGYTSVDGLDYSQEMQKVAYIEEEGSSCKVLVYEVL